MTPDEVLAKYRGNASLALSDANVEALGQSVLSLEESRNVGQALSPLRRATAAI
jgi:hypothetical protein